MTKEKHKEKVVVVVEEEEQRAVSAYPLKRRLVDHATRLRTRVSPLYEPILVVGRVQKHKRRVRVDNDDGGHGKSSPPRGYNAHHL